VVINASLFLNFSKHLFQYILFASLLYYVFVDLIRVVDRRQIKLSGVKLLLLH